MVTSLFWPSAMVVLSGVLFGFRRALVNCAYGAKSIRWNLRRLDVASEKGFAFTIREGCRELASEVGRVSEQTRLD